MKLRGVHHNTMEEAKILEYAALAESYSTHPISRSLKNAYGKEIDQNRVTDVEEISGNGVTAKVDGVSVAVGNAKLMKRIGSRSSRMSSDRNGHSCGDRRCLCRTYPDR